MQRAVLAKLRPAHRVRATTQATRRIALHEAGHAVMAYLFHRRVGAASAVPHGEILGQLEYRGFTGFPAGSLDDARARRRVEVEIMVALGGIAAEDVTRAGVDHAGASTDLARALEIALAATVDPEEATAFINWLFARARKRLREQPAARALHVLSRELARRGTLPGREVRAILARCFK